MLISFTVENFRSFKEEATLNFVANNGKEMRDSHVFTPELGEGVKSFDLLRSAVVYGPNAGGKSNFLRALKAMKEIVGYEHENNKKDGLTHWGMKFEDIKQITPFLFSDKTNTKPSTFEVVMMWGGVRYQYGLSATDEKIHGEWLYAFPNGRMQKWFERTGGKKKKEADRANIKGWEYFDYEADEYTFGGAFGGTKKEQKKWCDGTAGNRSFLFYADMSGSQQLQPIIRWFDENLHWTLHLLEEDYVEPAASIDYCRTARGREKMAAFLRNADFAIEGIEYEQEGNHYTFDMIHKTEEGGTVKIDLREESEGTQRMFAWASSFLEALEYGQVLIIDELNQRLHPHLMQYMIGLFNNPKTNPNNAQLIFTTHDVSLLKQDIFRRDQIWFCERGRDQASTLFPLTDFKPRKGFEDFESYYMSGRYGALPILGDFSDALKNEGDE